MGAELPADRLTGGWAEVVDAATDLGIGLEPRSTRSEQARALAEISPDAAIPDLATAIDHGVFGAGTPRDDFIDEVWAGTAASIKSLRASASRWRRIGYFANTASLRKPALTGPVKDRNRSLLSLLPRRKP